MPDVRFGRVMVEQEALDLRGARAQLIDENFRDRAIILIGESDVQQARFRIEWAAMPNAPSYLLAYSPFDVSQRAAAKAVFGEIDVGGKLPAAIAGLYPRGHGLSIRRREP